MWSTVHMGFGLWLDLDGGTAWAQGTHEYRPMGVAAVAVTDQFRPADFRQRRRLPAHLRNRFAGFYGSLEEVNQDLRRRRTKRTQFDKVLGPTPVHVR